MCNGSSWSESLAGKFVFDYCKRSSPQAEYNWGHITKPASSYCSKSSSPFIFLLLLSSPEHLRTQTKARGDQSPDREPKTECFIRQSQIKMSPMLFVYLPAKVVGPPAGLSDSSAKLLQQLEDEKTRTCKTKLSDWELDQTRTFRHLWKLYNKICIITFIRS